MHKEKVFVLGDSRTGTTTLHRFLSAAGFQSIHYYFKESGVQEPAHQDIDTNWQRLKTFIDSGAYNAFSDYPTRTFYKQLFSEYPEAYFILTTRNSIETWQKSMLNFFSKFEIKLDIEKLTKIHIEINNKIRELAIEKNLKLLEICIDDDADINGNRLSSFLGLDNNYSLGWENKANSYNNRLWSSRVTFFDSKAKDFLDYVKRLCNPSKAMLSEFGWTYLINDSSDYIDFCYGDKAWGTQQLENATSVLKDRVRTLAAKNILYRKFIVPEKIAVYPEYLPKIFQNIQVNNNRPAQMIMGKEIPEVSYLLDILLDAKSYGPLYFRGDSHANWLGAFFIYLHIIETINKGLNSKKRLIPKKLIELTPVLASYGGDIFTQLKKEQSDVYNGAWAHISLQDKSEYLIKYLLPERSRIACLKNEHPQYANSLGDRPLLIYESNNHDLPKALIFRDSTADFLTDLLAEHFSRSVFVWHRGAVYEDIIQEEQPDIVIHIMAERFFCQYQHAKPFELLH